MPKRFAKFQRGHPQQAPNKSGGMLQSAICDQYLTTSQKRFKVGIVTMEGVVRVT